VERLSAAAREPLAALLGDLTDERVHEACTWPDRYREEDPDSGWSAPLHYVNIDPAADRYEPRRDCADGRCLPAAIVHYAAELPRLDRAPDSRRRAFSFLCHFVGDLHQPLHVGYAEDRGGNLIEVTLADETVNLHALWDRVLVDRVAGTREDLLYRLRSRPGAAVPANWNPADVVAWVNESYMFTRFFAYPETRNVDEAFAERSAKVVLERLDRAASRLAGVLEIVLEDLPERTEEPAEAPAD
jgi:hypothetical protein